jgi:hypothetical protein
MRLAVCLVALLAAAAAAPSGTVADVVANNGNLTTLTALLKQADLTSTLAGAGPFTVFGAWQCASPWATVSIRRHHASPTRAAL